MLAVPTTMPFFPFQGLDETYAPEWRMVPLNSSCHS